MANKSGYAKVVGTMAKTQGVDLILYHGFPANLEKKNKKKIKKNFFILKSSLYLLCQSINKQQKTNNMNKQIKTMYKQMVNNTINSQAWYDFIRTQNEEEVKEVVYHMSDVEQRLKKFLNGYHYKTKIRSYCNQAGYSDWHPFEVVRVISDKCVEIRALDTKQTVFPKEIYVGGFSAHTADNHNQDYEYISNPENSTMRIRKGKKGWGNGRFHMSNHPYKFYDYNF